MLKLYLIKYIGIIYKGDSHTEKNVNARFLREIGIEPSQTLDQPTKDQLITFLEQLEVEVNDDIILHIIAHGASEGIAHELINDRNAGDIRTLITWDELIVLCNQISRRCHSIHVNLGTVCNSCIIKENPHHKHFNIITYEGKTTDPEKPRLLNKHFIDLIINGRTLPPDPPYEILFG